MQPVIYFELLLVLEQAGASLKVFGAGVTPQQLCPHKLCTADTFDLLGQEKAPAT